MIKKRAKTTVLQKLQTVMCNFTTMNKPHRLNNIFLLGIPLSMIFLSSKVVDVESGEYLLKGKVYIESKPLINDSIYFTYSYLAESHSKENTIVIKTDKEGNFEQTIEWSGMCGSGSYEWRKEKGLNKEEGYFELSKKLNADSLTFSYNKRWVKIKNNWIEAIQYLKKDPKKNKQFIVEQDIRF